MLLGLLLCLLYGSLLPLSFRSGGSGTGIRNFRCCQFLCLLLVCFSMQPAFLLKLFLLLQLQSCRFSCCCSLCCFCIGSCLLFFGNLFLSLFLFKLGLLLLQLSVVLVYGELFLLLLLLLLLLLVQ